LPLLERKKRLKAILPRHKLIAFSKYRSGSGRKFFAEAERKRLEGIMAKRADSPYASGGRTADWLKVKTAQRQEVVIAGFTAPRRTRPFFGALVLAVREDGSWRYIGHAGTGFSHQTLEALHGRLVKLKAAKSPCQGQGRGGHDLGSAVLGRGGEVRGVDEQRRAPANLSISGSARTRRRATSCASDRRQGDRRREEEYFRDSTLRRDRPKPGPGCPTDDLLARRSPVPAPKSPSAATITP
jgi:ATP-dependent DNA ligase